VTEPLLPPRPRFDAWISALTARHLADLRIAEVARALRALSSAYVERRGRLGRGAALDGAGKRAAFALFFGPQHYLLTEHIVTALCAAKAPSRLILDLGCGTGVTGAAWAMAAPGPPAVLGFDLHPWAVDEARWTYRTLGVDGTARRGDVCRVTLRRRPDGVIAAYLLNELDEARRDELRASLVGWALQGAAVLVIEPIARSITPWMDRWIPEAERAGGRYDEWRVAVDLPDIVRELERASGLDRRELAARTLFWPGRPKAGPPAPGSLLQAPGLKPEV
jgi:SAM-dependent methyltransferase